jgi:hypothetical protein
VILLADLDDAILTLLEPSTFTAFHVEVVGGDVDDDRLADVLAPHGRLVDDHAWIDVDAVVALAGDAVDDGWREGFDAMVAYARDSGFLSGDGTAIRAHLKPA